MGQVWRILIVVLCLVSPGTGSAMHVSIDSLKVELKTEINPQKRLYLLTSLADEQLQSGNKEALFTTDSAVKLAESLHFEIGLARALNLQGMAWKIWGDNQRSIVCLFRARSIYERLNMQNEYADVLANLGETNRAAGNLDKSMDFLNQALAIFISTNDTAGLAKTYDRLAATSYEYYLTEYNRYQDKLKAAGDRKFNFFSEYNANPVFKKMYDCTLRYAALSKACADKANIPSVKISTQIITGALYSITYQFDKALSIYQAVLSDINKYNSVMNRPLALYNIAILNYKKKEYQKALEYAMESYRIAKELDIKTYILLNAGLIDEVYEVLGDYKEATKYMRIFYVGRIDYYQRDIDLKLKNMQAEYTLEAKQREIDQRNSQMKFLYVFFITLSVLTTLFVVIMLMKNKRKREMNEELNKRNQIISKQNEELALLNNEKDKFFSIIAHDLRSPFNAFLGFTRMMAEDLQDLSRDEIQNIARLMRTSATNLYSLLDNLLAWSRLQRGLIALAPEPFRLMPKIAESLLSVIDLAEKKEIEISNAVPENMVVCADWIMFESIIRNIASNAIKFTPRGGKIIISATVQPGSLAEISIRDNGIGMSRELIEKLFLHDVRSNRKGTEDEPSTGLGLIICKDLIEKQGGKLWVVSEEGTGSEFLFTLPLATL